MKTTASNHVTASNGFRLTKCLMIHPYWDMALFEADLPNNIKPIALSITPYADLLKRDVVVIGYPAFDPERNDPDVQQEIFEGKYNVKRIAPGRIVNRKQPIGSAWLPQPVEALAHDSSTLGGNSGSAVVDVMSGHIAALHFAGRYLVENYGVPSHELARDPRVVDMGVNFASGPMPEWNRALNEYWSAADPDHSQPERSRRVVVDTGSTSTSGVSRQVVAVQRDDRVPDRFQAGNELYSRNPYDRGHVARRADVNWGPLQEARRANRESFFFTNITPQHQSFNQSSRHGLWGELENAILEDIEVENLKVSVMAGPIFQEDDPVHRGVRIPRDFWKLVAFRDTADDRFKVAAYILSQKELVPTEALELDRFNLYQVSLTKLSQQMNGELKFDSLASFDAFSSARESVTGSGVREITGRDNLLM